MKTQTSWLWLLGMAIGLACAGCVRNTAADGVTKPLFFRKNLQLDEASHGQTIHAAVGEVIVLELPANATTGYAWTPPQLTGESVIVERAGEYRPHKRLGPLQVGVGGTWQVKFKARSAGATQIRCFYQRSWEAPTPSDRSYHLKIVVADASASRPDPRPHAARDEASSKEK